MPSYAVFLRGINLGKRRLQMVRLKALIEQLEYRSVSTMLASGNLVLQAESRSPRAIEERIESHLADQLGYSVDTFVRTATELRAIAALTPFGPLENSGRPTMHIMFFKQPLPAQISDPLCAAATVEDQIEVRGRELYWLRQGRLSDSDYWQRSNVRSLQLPTSTMRTANTVRRLAAKLS